VKTLLQYFSWRYLRRHPIRLFLCVMSIALGVALFASIDISNTSTEAAFRKTVQKLAGKAQLQVVRSKGGGVEEEVLKKLDGLEGVEAAPVLQVSTTAPGSGGSELLLVMGLDLGREVNVRMWRTSEGEKPQVNPLAFLGNAILVSRSFADKKKIKLGAGFVLNTPTGPQKVVVATIFKDEGAAKVFGGNVAVMPLKTAQRLFGRGNTVDRIELLVTGNVDDAARRAAAKLGPDYVVRPPPTQNSLLDEALTRLRALLGIGVLALLVGIFIIYNSVSISVLERVREIGTLRAVGATRPQIFGVVLLEWSILGLLGSAAGLAIGMVLAKSLIEIWQKEVNQATMIVDISELAVLPRTAVGSLLVGTFTALMASYFPARAAMRVTPIEMLRQNLYVMASAPHYLRSFGCGIASMAFSLILISGRIPFEGVGLIGSFFAFLGAALAMPQLTLWISRWTRPLFERLFHLLGFLAADNISKFPQRTALTVIALAGALAMMVSSASIVLSIKVRSAEWMEDAFPFDVTVSATDYAATLYADVTLPPETTGFLASNPEIDTAYGVRSKIHPFGRFDVMVYAVDLDRYARLQELRGRTGFVPKGALPELAAGRGCITSYNFLKLHGKKEGDSVVLESPKGPQTFRILGGYEDYAWPQGTVYIDRSYYQDRWSDPALSYMDIKLKKGVDREQWRRNTETELRKSHWLYVYDVGMLKRLADSVMDNTLQLLNVQVALAIVIGFFGIVNTLLISVLSRTREIGLLRAVGMTTDQVGSMILIEALFMAVVGALLGIALGLAGAKWPLAFHVAQVSGYWLPLRAPWLTIGLAVMSAILIGAVASILPSRRAAKLNVLEAITYE
jgi:putative ABC transport system permease protein